MKLEPPSHRTRPGLKILQNSSDGNAGNATGNAGNATDNASVPPPVLELRQVKGNLTCAQPGCAADVLLQVYDPQKDGLNWLGENSSDFDPYSGVFFNRCVSDSQIGGDNLGNTKPSAVHSRRSMLGTAT